MADLERRIRDHRRRLETLHGLDKLFIVGCAKSGTTWVMNLLNGHPGIAVRGEGSFAWKLAPLLDQAIRAFNAGMTDQDPLTRLRETDQQLALRALVDGQLLRYIEASGKDPARLRIVGDKTPQHSVSMSLLAGLYPRARFIHVIRDPRDAAISAWFHFGRGAGRSFDAYIEYFITEVWPLNVGRARDAGRHLSGRCAEVRFEDLLADEPGEIRRLLEFLGVDATPVEIEACRAAGAFERHSGGRARGEADASSFYRRGVAGDWFEHIAPDLARRCCTSIAALMRACGYDPGDPLMRRTAQMAQAPVRSTPRKRADADADADTRKTPDAPSIETAPARRPTPPNRLTSNP